MLALLLTLLLDEPLCRETRIDRDGRTTTRWVPDPGPGVAAAAASTSSGTGSASVSVRSSSSGTATASAAGTSSASRMTRRREGDRCEIVIDERIQPEGKP